jgi:hypothetical protein
VEIQVEGAISSTLATNVSEPRMPANPPSSLAIRIWQPAATGMANIAQRDFTVQVDFGSIKIGSPGPPYFPASQGQPFENSAVPNSRTLIEYREIPRKDVTSPRRDSA